MREIKFRAWDKANKCMILASTRKARPIDDEFPLSKQMENDDYLLMQYTGLKDKNGIGDISTDIYEGDIVSLHGTVIGNIHENSKLGQDKTNLIIKGFGTGTWRTTEKEAMDRGCSYSE